ncbi:MAG: tripartite tricarboxylate transporter substrate binding protein [Bacteroidota bacterium]|nr:tripartite tricarboxylate transporter substrate binding protein [Kiloniellaceae bacterium]
MKTFASLAAAVIAAASLGIAAPAGAQSYPEKPINYIIPFGPGGESDITARHQQAFFGKMFGQELVIEYKPGGGGAVGWSQLNDYQGDGYTWMGVNLPHIVVQPMEKDVGYKTDDLTIVYMFHFTPDALVVHKDSEFKTLQDLVDYAKANPGKVTLSGSGKATSNHIAQVLFDGMAGIQTTYVPFKGTGAAVTALLGEQVMAEWGYTSVGASHKDQVRMLAVAMDERHPLFPDVPTFKELGYELSAGAYRGIAVPSSTPEELRKQISDMIGQINADPEFRTRLENDGMAMLDVGYEEMGDFMAKMKDTYHGVAKQAGIVQ